MGCPDFGPGTLFYALAFFGFDRIHPFGEEVATDFTPGAVTTESGAVLPRIIDDLEM